MGTDDIALSSSSPRDENTLFPGAGVPALSDAIALQQYKFEQLLANQELWSQQRALEQEAKIKAAAELVQTRASELSKVLYGGDDATPKLDAQESFHERHIHDLRQYSEAPSHFSKPESKLVYPDTYKKEKEDYSPKCIIRKDRASKEHDRSSPHSSGRYRGRRSRSRSRDRRRGWHRDKSRSRSRSRSRDRRRGWRRDKSRSRSRGREVGRHREKTGSRNRSEERVQDTDKTRRSRSKERVRGTDKSRRSRSRERVKEDIVSRSKGGVRDRWHRDYLKEKNTEDKNGVGKQKGKDGKRIENDKSIEETLKHSSRLGSNKFSEERITREDNSNNSGAGKFAPVCRNYQTSACDEGSLATAKSSTGGSPAPAPAPIDHQPVMEEREIDLFDLLKEN